MIDGVEIKQLKRHADERGYLMEMLRADDDIFEVFGQTYVSMNYPEVIRAWHYHKEQTDLWVCVKGMIKVGLYDAREDSPTHGQAQAVYMGDNNNILLKIPVGVYHGYKTIGVEPSLLINFPSKTYNREHPDEYRAPFDTPKIPFDWDIKFL
ncbi:MAG: dTDP-4-dehydrorhamnose 3,5-epimerase family protein [Armatimonadota bacterium]